MTIIKFVIRHGRLASQHRISPGALDGTLLAVARGALARLREGQPAVSVSWPDGTGGVVGLGLPAMEMPVGRLSEDLRQAWEAGREARERQQRRTAFFITTSGKTEVCSLAREAAVFDVPTPWHLSPGMKSQVEATNLAALYGAVVGTFGQAEMRKPADERDLAPSAERIQQFWEVATQIVAAAPAFMCHGRLDGAQAAFADCFAIAMLSAPDASAERTTAA